MSAPYNPGPGNNQPGEQPQWGGYPSGTNYQQPGPSGGYPGQDGQGGYGYQGGYPQQGGYYQQGNYSAQQGGYSYPQQSWGGGYGAAPRESAGIIGLVGAAVGALLLILGIAALAWYSAEGQDVKLSDLRDGAKAGDVGLMKAYGGYLAWILLAVVVVAAVLASLPIGPTALAMRIIAPVVGVLGIVLTLLALNSYFDKAKDAGASDVGIFKHSAIGLYLTLAGFLIAGVAGIFGPRRA